MQAISVFVPVKIIQCSIFQKSIMKCLNHVCEHMLSFDNKVL